MLVGYTAMFQNPEDGSLILVISFKKVSRLTH